VPSPHSERYFAAVADLAQTLDLDAVDELATRLATLRSGNGRLFVLGVGGGAGHASHAVNDFRKMCDIESYAVTDNVSELTARTNDEGWETTFRSWLQTSRLCGEDGLLVFSVGGGSREHGVSVNIVNAVEFARERSASVYGIVGAPGGEVAKAADVVVVVAAPSELRTPLVESLQAVVWHALVSHPALALQQGHWETITERAAGRVL
jgi:D-sedoheptulose 7-phosphate isomerase